MKTHAIIPIFIPHEGCPHQCVFCNQKKITARTKAVEVSEVTKIIETHLSTLSKSNVKTIEIGFYGGSFTAIPLDKQAQYLQIAQTYKQQGLIHQIHLSTRPDCIDDAILSQLKKCSVDTIELGVQSFDEEVLLASNRGHSKKSVYDSVRRIKEYHFKLGIQLMIGLPKDTKEKSIASAKETAMLKPDVARLYPTVILPNTPLYDSYMKGAFHPFTHDDMIETTKNMYRILQGADIQVIRVGLKSSDLINSAQENMPGTLHPAFRHLVESEIAKEDILSQLALLPEKKDCISLYSNEKSFSNLIGHKKSNLLYLREQYPESLISFHKNPSLADYQYLVKLG